MEEQDSQQELEHRGEVLQQSDGGQRHPHGGHAEADQGDRGDQAAEDEQQGVPGALGGERAAAAGGEQQQEAQGGQELDRGLGGQGLQPAQVDLLLHQPVDGEGEGEGEGDPRQAPVSDGQDHDGRRAGADRGPLGGAEPLPQQQHAEGDGDQGVDEVAERGLHDVPAVDAPDVQAPVDGYHRGGERDEPQPLRLPHQLAHPRPAAQHQQDGGDGGERPHHAVGEDLGGAGGFEERPVEGEEPPHAVGGETEPEARALLVQRTLPGTAPARRPRMRLVAGAASVATAADRPKVTPGGP